LVDYWQFSRRIDDPKNCRRSGINITKNEFRSLGKQITSYLKDNFSREFAQLTSSMGLNSTEPNIYNALSKFLISNNTPSKLTPAKVRDITKSWVEVLEIVTKNADKISKLIANENVPANPEQAAKEEDANLPPEAN
jgi:hypothetical protein